MNSEGIISDSICKKTRGDVEEEDRVLPEVEIQKVKLEELQVQDRFCSVA